MVPGIYGYWISPTSDVHTVYDDFGHKDAMEEIIGRKIDNPEVLKEELFDNGWIRLVNNSRTLMVNYKHIVARNQIRVLEKVEKELEKFGYNHEKYILDYGYGYHFFDTMRDLLERVQERL